uniref:Prostate transmembrane protein, androgen induced 1 n=1 Tax=Petromyzon marinus TaxID=7757 RepID=S4RPL5_PETMA
VCAAGVEFVQILVIVSVAVVMVLVITCILNHYKISSSSFMGRHMHRRRRDHPCTVRPLAHASEAVNRGHGHYEPSEPPGFLGVHAFMPRDPFRRPPHQPLYPYSQVEIDLPPSISLSDGEEPPPYQGPCTLQLRPPEQQQEINRESVRAPPNRTVYDSDYYVAPPPCAALGGGGGGGGGAGPCPPSSHSGVSAASYGGHGGRMEGPPPTYSEVVG